MHNFDPESRKQSLRIAVICSSNMNRSMEGHRLLQKKGFNISSYGTGTQVNKFLRLQSSAFFPFQNHRTFMVLMIKTKSFAIFR